MISTRTYPVLETAYPGWQIVSVGVAKIGAVSVDVDTDLQFINQITKFYNAGYRIVTLRLKDPGGASQDANVRISQLLETFGSMALLDGPPPIKKLQTESQKAVNNVLESGINNALKGEYLLDAMRVNGYDWHNLPEAVLTRWALFCHNEFD